MKAIRVARMNQKDSLVPSQGSKQEVRTHLFKVYVTFGILASLTLTQAYKSRETLCP